MGKEEKGRATIQSEKFANRRKRGPGRSKNIVDGVSAQRVTAERGEKKRAAGAKWGLRYPAFTM